MVSISENNKTIAKNTIYLYFRLVFSVIVGLYTSRVVLKTLGAEDYGIYNLVGGFVTLLSIFTFSISGTCQRFLVYELGRGDKKNLSDTFCTIKILLLFFAAVFFAFAGLVGPWVIHSFLNIPAARLDAAVMVFYCSLVVFCMQLLAVPYTSLVIAHEKMGFYSIMSIFEMILKLSVVLSIKYVYWDQLVYYALTLAMISVVVRVVYNIYCRIHYEEAKFYWRYNKSISKEITSFTIWVGTGAFAGLLKDQGGGVIINLFFGVLLNAACGIANQAKSFVNLLSSNVGLAISPQITKSYSSGNKERAIKLTFLLAKAQTLMILLVALPVFIETPRLMELWLGDVPEYTVLFVRAILLVCVVQALETSYGPLFLAIGRVKKFELIASLITILVLPLTYLCYSCGFHPISYYIVYVLIEAILFVYSYGWLKYEISFPFKQFIKEIVIRLVLICIITYGLQILISNVTALIIYPILQMLINMVTCVLLFIGTSYLIVLNNQERELVIKLVRSKILHKPYTEDR